MHQRPNDFSLPAAPWGAAVSGVYFGSDLLWWQLTEAPAGGSRVRPSAKTLPPRLGAQRWKEDTGGWKGRSSRAWAVPSVMGVLVMAAGRARVEFHSARASAAADC